jgi:RNA polymerase sigma-70 factor (ECF subfamily)
MKKNPADFGFASFERHRARLQSLAHGWLGSAADAQDAVQDTWLRAAAWPGTPDNELAWLVTALRHICIDRLRERRLASRHAEALVQADVAAHTAPSAEDLAMTREEAQSALRTVLKRLSQADAAALLLHAAFDHEHAEIAVLAGMTTPAMRQRVHRALARVRGPVRTPDEASDRAKRQPDQHVDDVFIQLCLRALQEARAAVLIAAVSQTTPTRASAAAHGPLVLDVPESTGARVQLVSNGGSFGLAWMQDGTVSCVVPLGPCAVLRGDEAEAQGAVAS